MTAPNSEERKKCWTSRDIFWDCMTQNNDNVEKCKGARESFENNCSKTWVKYFDRRRDYLKYKKKMEEESFVPADSSKKKT